MEYFQLDDNDIDTIIRAKDVNEASIEIDCDMYTRLSLKSRIPVIVEWLKQHIPVGVEKSGMSRTQRVVTPAMKYVHWASTIY